jgi:hypothetical protein
VPNGSIPAITEAENTGTAVKKRRGSSHCARTGVSMASSALRPKDMKRVGWKPSPGFPPSLSPWESRNSTGIPTFPPLRRRLDTKTPGDLLKRAPAIHPHLKMRSYTWALSGDFSAKLDLFGEAQSMDDLDALIEYVEITVKALKRSLKAASVSVPSPESFAQAPSPPEP